MRLYLALLAALVVAPAATSQEVTFTDGLGKTVTLAQPPERVVALYNDGYGHMASLGVRPVAILANPEMLRDETFYFEDGISIPNVENADGSADPELIVTHAPDLIIAWSAEEAEQLSQIAPVITLAPFTGFEGPKAALRTIAAVLGRSALGEEKIAAFDAKVAAYAARVPERPTVLKLSAMEDNQFAFGTSSDPICPLLNQIVTCEWDDGTIEGWGYEGTLEQALALDPEVIILNNWSEMDDATFMASIEANPLWSELQAVRNDRVIHLPDYSNPIYSSIAAGHKAIDTLIPAMFPEEFPNGALTEDDVAGVGAQ